MAATSTVQVTYYAYPRFSKCQVCVVRFSGLRPVLVKLHTLASWTGHMSSL